MQLSGFIKFIFVVVLSVVYPSAGFSQSAFLENGAIWADSDGHHINAHGGGILYRDGIYYWYGEARSEKGSGKSVDGVSCYSSKNLVDWQNQGVVLPVVDSVGSDIEAGCKIERPKVVYNSTTGKYVMWFHLELKGKGYDSARAGVAVSESPVGPFRFLYSGRINPGLYPADIDEVDKYAAYPEDLEWWTPLWHDEIRRGMFMDRDRECGQMSRDMTVFVDDDGQAYHIYSSEDNLTLHIAGLSDDYTHHNGKYVRIFPGGHNEAPAVFKHDGCYWMIASGCTGWDPNEARLMTAESIWGPWRQLSNPCVGENSELTFGAQSTFVLKIDDDRFVAMFDIWRPSDLIDSRYIWLHVEFDSETGMPFIRYKKNFELLSRKSSISLGQ